MNVALIISEYDHLKALDHAVEQNPRSLNELHARLVDDEERWLNRLWSAVKDAILASARSGVEAAREKLDYFQGKLAEAAAQLGERIEEINRELGRRLNDYLRDVIEQALGRVEPKVTIGASAMSLKSLTLQQTFKLSSSLSISLNTICAFVAEGQVAVSAAYEAS